MTFATSIELVHDCPFVHDTNGYYRALGIRTDATRREIREAYQKLKGWRSPRLTYIVSQLLDPKTRERYDSTPLGDYFFDVEVEEWMKRARLREIDKLRREGVIIEVQEGMADEDFEEEWEAPNVLDNPTVADDNDRNDEGWPWAFYLMGEAYPDRERMRRWQKALIAALGSREENYDLALGLMARGNSSWQVQVVGYRTVVFLSDREQPEAHAEAVAEWIRASIGDK